jgi:hypothetical protein
MVATRYLVSFPEHGLLVIDVQRRLFDAEPRPFGRRRDPRVNALRRRRGSRTCRSCSSSTNPSLPVRSDAWRFAAGLQVGT